MLTFEDLLEISGERLPEFAGRTFHRFADHADCCVTADDSEYCGHDDLEASGPETADLVSSLVKSDSAAQKTWHLPVIDLDIPVDLVASASPDHYHLYIDQACTWDQYLRLLDILVEIGYVQPGYLEAAKRRGYTSVRVPWKPKG